MNIEELGYFLFMDKEEKKTKDEEVNLNFFDYLVEEKTTTNAKINNN